MPRLEVKLKIRKQMYVQEENVRVYHARLCLLHKKIDYDRKGCITYAIKSELRAAVEFDI
mgnify:CR=1 FL=1